MPSIGDITPITSPSRTFGFLSMDRSPSGPPADTDWLILATDPTAMPTFKPYGQPNPGSDGATANYLGLPNLVLTIPVLGINSLPDGTTPTGGAGTGQSWFSEWRRCRARTGSYTDPGTGISHTSLPGRMWIRSWWPELDSIVCFLATPGPAEWSGAHVQGLLYRDLAIPLLAVGALSPSFQGGNANPPDPSTPGGGGDNEAGGFGVGVFGYSYFGGASS